jgi:type II restriction enzyme
MNVPSRSWTLDVLNRVRMIQKDRFSLQDVYAFEHELAVAYPGNRNVRAKIRQQLQVLRDLRLLVFEGHGWYRLTPQ